MNIININNITIKKYKYVNKTKQQNEIEKIEMNKKEKIKKLINEGKYEINIEKTTQAMTKWWLK